MCAISHILHLMCASPIMPRVHAQSAQQAVVVSVRRETVNLFKLNICQAFILFLLQARLLGLWFCHPLASWVIICHHQATQAVLPPMSYVGHFSCPLLFRPIIFVVCMSYWPTILSPIVYVGPLVCHPQHMLAHQFVTHSICWPTSLSPIVYVGPLFCHPQLMFFH